MVLHVIYYRFIKCRQCKICRTATLWISFVHPDFSTSIHIYHTPFSSMKSVLNLAFLIIWNFVGHMTVVFMWWNLSFYTLQVLYIYINVKC